MLCRLSAAPSSRRGAGETSLAALHETVGMTGPVGRTTVGIFWQRPRPPDAWLPRVHIQSPSDGLPRRSALMAISRRRTGIPPVGDIAWGTHVCLLYQTPTDVLEMLVAYVHAGLEAHEYCLIVTSPALMEGAVVHALRPRVPAVQDHVGRGDLALVAAHETEGSCGLRAGAQRGGARRPHDPRLHLSAGPMRRHGPARRRQPPSG